MSHKVFHFYLHDGKARPIFKFFFTVKFKRIFEGSLNWNYHLPQSCCRTTLWKVSDHQHSFTFILARIVRLCQMASVSWVLVCLFIYPDTDVIVTLLQYFVCCITHSLHCALSLAAQCIVIGPVCVFAIGGRRVFVGVWVCAFVGLLPRWLEIACIDLHQTGSVGEGSHHLQLIKFWPSCTPGKEVCGGMKIFGSALLQSAAACSVCISPSAFFIL